MYDIFGLRFNPYRFLKISYPVIDNGKEGEILFVLTEDSERAKNPMNPYDVEVRVNPKTTPG